MHRTPNASHAAGILAPTTGDAFDCADAGIGATAGRADRGQRGLAPTFRP
jgi:hypothetical protein